MGSTGNSRYRHNTIMSDTFGIDNAVAYKGKIPHDSGLILHPDSDTSTLKFPINNKESILFQFRLSKDNKYMTIIGFRDGVPQEKAKLEVDSGNPSIDKVIASGKRSERLQAVKLKKLMHESGTLSENKLDDVATALIKKKLMNKR